MSNKWFDYDVMKAHEAWKENAQAEYFKQFPERLEQLNKLLTIKFMYALKNKVQLIGTVDSDPEFITLPNGKKFAKFSLVTHESYKGSEGEKIDEFQIHNLVALDKVADTVKQYVQKGIEIAIEGKLQHNEHIDPHGIKRYVTEVLVTEILLLTKTSK